MGSGTDETKGRIKEAVGDLTDNDDLRREGKTDQAGAKAKEVVEDAKDSAESMIDKVKGKLDK